MRIGGRFTALLGLVIVAVLLTTSAVSAHPMDGYGDVATDDWSYD